MVSPLFDRSKSPFRIYDIFCSKYIIYSVQNIKNILNTTYDIYWAEYILYCAHLVGILDLWDLSDGKGEGKVHLLLPRRLVCKSQIEIPDTINKLCFLNKKKNLLTEEGWLGDLVAPGYTPRNRLVTQARVRVLHQGTKLPPEFKFCILCKVSFFFSKLVLAKAAQIWFAENKRKLLNNLLLWVYRTEGLDQQQFNVIVLFKDKMQALNMERAFRLGAWQFWANAKWKMAQSWEK